MMYEPKLDSDTDVLPPVHEHFVLIVDDNPMTLVALKRTLRDEPYEVLVADTPDQAFEILETRPVSLLLCDQRMPEMSGLEVVKAAREQTPEMTCLILTGYPESISLRETIQCGVRFIIEKPWNDLELRKTIRHLLREKEL